MVEKEIRLGEAIVYFIIIVFIYIQMPEVMIPLTIFFVVFNALNKITLHYKIRRKD